jgi:hypothetical protein
VPPVGAAVERFVNAAVAADEVVIRVLGIDPHFVVVHVFPAAGQRAERSAAVVGDLDEDVHHVNAVAVLRVDDDV